MSPWMGVPLFPFALRSLTPLASLHPSLPCASCPRTRSNVMSPWMGFPGSVCVGQGNRRSLSPSSMLLTAESSSMHIAGARPDGCSVISSVQAARNLTPIATSCAPT